MKNAEGYKFVRPQLQQSHQHKHQMQKPVEILRNPQSYPRESYDYGASNKQNGPQVNF
jgi:hypothetical protein